MSYSPGEIRFPDQPWADRAPDAWREAESRRYAEGVSCQTLNIVYQSLESFTAVLCSRCENSGPLIGGHFAQLRDRDNTGLSK